MTLYEGPPVVVEQSLAVGGQFNGTIPSAAPPADVDGVRIYPAENAPNGGRFKWGPTIDVGGVARELEFGEPASYNVVERVIADFVGLPGGATWTIEIVNVAGRRVTWLSGAPGDAVYSGDDTELILAPDEWLELSTSAVATGACFIRVWARRHGVYGSK